MAVALNEATTTVPRSSPRRSAEPVVTSATTGPTRTRTRPPIGTSDATGARMWLRLESSAGDVVASATSQGWTTAPTGPSRSDTE